MAGISIAEKITSKNNEIASLQASIVQLKASEADWRAQSQVACKFSLKSKQQACLADKAWKKSQADSKLAQWKALEDQVNQLKTEISVLTKAQEAENTATVNLSTQGLSNAALQIKAEGEAAAAVEQAKIEANAKAAAITTGSETDNKNKTIIIAVVGLVVVVIVAIALKKFVFNKKKSKK